MCLNNYSYMELTFNEDIIIMQLQVSFEVKYYIV